MPDLLKKYSQKTATNFIRNIMKDNIKNKTSVDVNKKNVKLSTKNLVEKSTDQNQTSEKPIEILKDEIWVKIPNVDKHYEVSNYGRVISFVSGKGVLLKNKTIAGYKTIDLRIDNKRKNRFIHKIVAELFVANSDPEKKIVCHNDYDKLNNHFSNLRWVSSKELFAHVAENNEKIRTQFINNSHTNKNSKLTKLDVDKIRELIQKGVKQNIISKLFCVSEMQISRIKRNENWVN